MNAQMPYSPTLTNPMTLQPPVSPRLINRKLNVIRHAVHAVQKQTGRVINKDVATYLGVTLDEYNHILQDANTYRLFSAAQGVS
jgi:DNA-directed RNA polymerase specialized sigma subunit